MASSNLQRESGMKNSPKRNRALLSFAFGRNSAELDYSSIHLQSNSPDACTRFLDADEPRNGVSEDASAVLSVECWRDITQVAEPIVRRISVDVVKVLFWPLSGGMEPCKPVAKVGGPIQSDDDVSVFSVITRHVASLAMALAVQAPCECARGLVVVKKLAQTLRGNIGLSHDALQLLIGQRPQRVSARLGLRYCGA